jgi:ubiquinone/menaquinone biosynthesis C-methylase UbiE
MRQLLRKLYYQLAPKWRFLVRRIYYLPSDWFHKEATIPPKGLIYTGSGDFKKQGEILLKRTIEHTALQPHHKVLDIGSGIGRFAIPLSNYLDATGTYNGFDVVEKGVDWCQKHISSKYPNFLFQYIPLNNDLYRSDGANAANFTFPYEAESFNRVVLFSVFTHLQGTEVANYIKEISRVLEKGGFCLATFFIIDKTEKRYANPAFTFPYEQEGYYLMDKKVKAANVGFSKKYLENLAAKNDLELSKIIFGWWSKNEKIADTDFQDLVIFRKK